MCLGIITDQDEGGYVYRKCSKCKIEKPLKEFHKDKARKYGRDYVCIKCRKEYCDANKEKTRTRSKQHYEANKEKIQIQHKIWKKNNPDKVRASHNRCGAKRRMTMSEIEFKATTEQVNKLIKDSDNKCFWCDKDIPKGELHIDHIYPLSKYKDHTISNLCVSCEDCNRRKFNKEPEDWLDEILQQTKEE